MVMWTSQWKLSGLTDVSVKGSYYLEDDVLKVPRFLLTNLKHQFLQLYQRKLSIAVSDCMIGVALWS